MPIGDKVEAVKGFLQFLPVKERPVQMPQVKFSGGSHSADNPLFFH
jgi:hypothetical protein